MFILEPNDGGLATLERGSKLAMQGAQSIADMRKEYRVRKQAQEMAKALGKPEMATLYELAMLQKPEEFFSNFTQRQMDQQFMDLIFGKQPQGAPNKMVDDLAAPDAIPDDILSQNFSPDGSPMEGAEMPMPPSEEALEETVNAFKVAQDANAGGMPQAQSESPASALNKLSDEKLMIMSGMKGNWGDFARNLLQTREKARKEERRAFEADRSYHGQLNKKNKERVDAMRRSVPAKARALSLARNAYESGKVGAFSKDAIANLLPEPFSSAMRTAEGAQLITAGKENLISNLSDVSARAQNLWIEKRFSSMFPQIGQSVEANQTISEMLEAEVALDDAYLKSYDRIAEQDRKEFGYVREDAAERAQKQIAPLEKQIVDRTAFRLKEVQEAQESDRQLRAKVGKSVVKGTPLTMRMANQYVKKYNNIDTAVKAAKANGYTIPTKEQARIYLKSFDELANEQG